MPDEWFALNSALMELNDAMRSQDLVELGIAAVLLLHATLNWSLFVRECLTAEEALYVQAYFESL